MVRICVAIAMFCALWTVALPHQAVAQTAAGIPGCTAADPLVAVPTIMIHGTADQTVPFAQSVELNDLLTKAGVTFQLLPGTGGGHGLILGQVGPQQQKELVAMIAFFDRVFQSRPP